MLFYSSDSEDHDTKCNPIRMPPASGMISETDSNISDHVVSDSDYDINSDDDDNSNNKHSKVMRSVLLIVTIIVIIIYRVHSIRVIRLFLFIKGMPKFAHMA